MSTLKADTIQNTSGGAVTLTDQYAAKAWANFNGTGTPAIRESQNVTSISDEGTGNHGVNFTTAMPDSNYSITASGGNGASIGTVFVSPRLADPAPGAVRLASITASDTLLDVSFMSVAIFR